MAKPELRFPEFTDEWEEKILGEELDIRDGTHDSPSYVLKDGYPLVTSKNLTEDGKLDFSDISYISKNDFIEISKRSNVSVGDILFGMIGTIGKPVIVKRANFAIKNVALIKSGTTILNTYLYQYLQNNHIKRQFLVEKTGGTQKFIALGVIRKLCIYTPVIEEQRKIANFLSSVDDMIQIQEEEISALEEQKKSIMQKIFSCEVRFKEDDGSEYPEWEEKKLEEVVVFLDGQRRPLEKGERLSGIYPYYGASGIIDYVDGYLFEGEHILLSEDGANIIDRNYRVCFLANGKYWVNNHAHVLKARNGNNNNFICEQLESFNYIKYNTGTAQPKLNQDVCKKIRLKMPCFQEQQKIADCLLAFEEIIQIKREKLEVWKKIKKGLLQQMFV